MGANAEDWVVATASFIGIVVASAIMYIVKKPASAIPPIKDSVMTSVGLELGNRMQVDQLIAEQKRLADGVWALVHVLSDKNQAAIKDKLDDLMERLEDSEKRSHR